MDGALAQELSRLSRARAATEGRRTAKRTLLLLLLALLAVVLVHRLLLPLDALVYLDARPLFALLVLALSIPIAWLLGTAVAFAARPPRRDLARRLDDDLHLSDALDTALSLDARGATGPLDGLALSLAVRRAAAFDPAAIWPPYRGGRRLPLVLLLAIAFLFFAPGVLGTGGKTGAGAGEQAGIGRRNEPDTAKPPDVVKTPEDADRWLREHGKLVLSVPRPAGEPLAWRADLMLDGEAPAALAGDVTFFFDKQGPFGPVGTASIPRGLREDATVLFDAGATQGLKPHLTPGKHRAFARFTPTMPPWKASLDSNEIEVDVLPPAPKGGGGSTPPPPKPPPPEPKGQGAPPPEPPPSKGSPPKPPPPVVHDEVVKPLSKDGPTVKKDQAVVEVKDPNAGSIPPDASPLAEALRDFQKVLERAVNSERVLPSDKAFLVRYLEALRRAVGTAGAK